MRLLTLTAPSHLVKRGTRSATPNQKNESSWKMVLWCCSSSTHWFASWHALSGVRAPIIALCFTGTWQHQEMIPWHKYLPKAPVITSVNPCMLQSLLHGLERFQPKHYEPCLCGQPKVVLLSKGYVCTNTSLCWFLHLSLPPFPSGISPLLRLRGSQSCLFLKL